MRIRVTVTLDVDPEAWEVTYGVERKDIREDVQRWAEDGLRSQLDAVDCAATA